MRSAALRSVDAFGLAIGSMGEQTYYVAFCGPGGGFAEATYRPETNIRGYSSYTVVDADTLDIVGFRGRDAAVRPVSRSGRGPMSNTVRQ